MDGLHAQPGTAALGISTLGFGPGDPSLAHRVDEYIELDELHAGARGYATLAAALTRKGKPSGVWVTHQKMRRAEKQPAAQAQASYQRTTRDWQASGPNKQRKWARA